jgi:ABC-type uncharacterized transport system ATPase subunit
MDTKDSDRELLRWAAKAAGHSLVWGEKHKLGDDTIDCTDIAYIRSGQSDDGDVYWNPLEDYGDALELAVRLELSVSVSRLACTASHLHIWHVISEPGGRDIGAATRLAIVRAAAELGRLRS